MMGISLRGWIWGRGVLKEDKSIMQHNYGAEAHYSSAEA